MDGYLYMLNCTATVHYFFPTQIHSLEMYGSSLLFCHGIDAVVKRTTS
ncbi:MAG: hypothetical protein H6577_18900 [Lewinellaceae bacterium]|nr:hypothetical protein [Saprospiraceae bacterium]MCB9340195.1 hypothetical protein [Lewinellaceae bacterium]